MTTFNRIRVTIKCVDLDGDGGLDYEHVFELGDNADCRELQCLPPYTGFELAEAANVAKHVFLRSFRITRDYTPKPKEEE